MKTQDLYPYDATLPGLNNIYHTIGPDSHYINSPAIIAHHKIVRTGSTYLLSLMTKTQDTDLIAVELKDVYFISGYVHLLLMNLLNGKTFEICTIVRPTEEGRWKLINLDYLSKIINKHQKRGTKDDSLLEFEF